MASAPTHATVTVSIVPDVAGFKLSLLADLIEADIITNWYALEKRIAIGYQTENRAINLAIRHWGRVVDPV